MVAGQVPEHHLIAGGREAHRRMSLVVRPSTPRPRSGSSLSGVEGSTALRTVDSERCQESFSDSDSIISDEPKLFEGGCEAVAVFTILVPDTSFFVVSDKSPPSLRHELFFLLHAGTYGEIFMVLACLRISVASCHACILSSMSMLR